MSAVSFAPFVCWLCVNLMQKRRGGGGAAKLETIINKCAGLSKYLNKGILGKLQTVPCPSSGCLLEH